MWRADFEDCFNQIPLSQWSMLFAGVRFRGVLYCFRRGSYGYSNFPSLAQTLVIALTRSVTRHMQKAGLKCGIPPTFQHRFTYNRPAPRGHQHTTLLAILDDVGGFATSTKAATFGFLLYCWLTYSVGYKLSQKPMKTMPPTSEDMLFIGYMLSIQRMITYLDSERIAKMIQTMDDVMARGDLTLNELQKLLGVLVFCCTILAFHCA